MTVTYETLYKKEQKISNSADPEFILRMHRAISWIGKGQTITNDDDMQFLCFWIAFNATYSQQKDLAGEEIKELRKVAEYFEKISKLDSTGRLYEIIWNNFAQQIRILINNTYVFGPFWNFERGEISAEELEQQFANSNRKFLHSFEKKETGIVLSILFSRLYVLRNQLVHGSSTYKSSKNREQVSISNILIQQFVPVFVDVMLENFSEDWGNPLYPVVEK